MDKNEYSQISFKPQPKRSSLKNLIAIDTVKEIPRRKSCSIHWENGIKDTEPQIKKTKTLEKKLKDLQTIYPKTSIDEEDLYLNQLASINQITPTKEVIEEIVEMIKEKDLKSTGFNKERKRSIKDEISIPKELLKNKSDEELDTELIEETMKNTLINKIVGKLED